MNLQHINDIASVCAGHGIRTAVISPGSRSAALTLAFTRHPDIETFVISDERSAAFIAMGMAQQQQRPVVLVCTSGSAAYNYAPAIAEAYYQEIPLLVLTADRPPEWVDQFDGQTIRQSGIYGKHVKSSFDFPSSFNHPDTRWHANRITNESILTAIAFPEGPVHINVPLREPFYPEEGEETTFSKVRVMEQANGSVSLKQEDWEKIKNDWNRAEKPLIVAGQSGKDDELIRALEQFCSATHTPLISDTISNARAVSESIWHQDLFLQESCDEQHQELIPDLLITFGKSVISKNLKRFLRKYPATTHWHVQTHDRFADTFQSITSIVRSDAVSFFNKASDLLSQKSPEYLQAWKSKDTVAKKNISKFFETCEFGEMAAINSCLKRLPVNSQLHLANSMAVRYANYLSHHASLEVFANRGTSGIDGSNSTAVGAALSGKKLVTLITGDMAFFYDRNAFWHNYDLKNLRVIILNNQGGGIFRMIKGPSSQPELEEYFETRQNLTAKNTASDFNLDYQECHSQADLDSILSQFFEPSLRGRILEVHSEAAANTKLLHALRNQLSEAGGS